MSVTLSIKNVPDEVARALRNRAVGNQRTLQDELLHILKQAARAAPAVGIDDLLEQSSRKKPALDETTSRILAAKDAEQERTARRFADLLSGDDDR
jgi:plasmid stability protein